MVVTVAAAISAPAAAVCGHQVALVGVVIVCLGVGAVNEEVAYLALDDLKEWTWLLDVACALIVLLEDRWKM